MATSRSDPPAPVAPVAAMRSGTVGRADHTLPWERAGEPGDPAVVFLHHGLGSTRAWKHQLPAFVSAGWQTLAYDRWGYGRSSPRPSLDLPGFGADLEDLEAVLDAQGLERAVLVGHSDGGTVALYFAARFPERVSALVTVAAHIYLEATMLPGMLALRQAFEHDERFRQGLVRAHGDKVDSVFRNWYEGWVRAEHLAWDMRPMLSGVRCPTLVIQGELDEHATPQHARDVAAAVADGHLWLMPGVGHMPAQDQPDEFNRRVLEFLEPFRSGSR